MASAGEDGRLVVHSLGSGEVEQTIGGIQCSLCLCAASRAIVCSVTAWSCKNKPTFRQSVEVLWNLSIKDTQNEGHLSNEDTVCSPNHIELCTKLPLN